jgi:hypothetical protein
MTTVVRPLGPLGPLGDEERKAAVERASELLNEARSVAPTAEWVVDLASRRIVRRPHTD